MDRVRRDIESQIEERLHDAVGDLHRRFGEAVERVSERLQEDENGKPLVFRDSMISNIRELVDVVPRLNIFGDDELARLCEQVKDKIASVEPDALRPSIPPNLAFHAYRDADDMPCLRQSSATGTPASCSFKIPMICSSEKRDRFSRPVLSSRPDFSFIWRNYRGSKHSECLVVSVRG